MFYGAFSSSSLLSLADDCSGSEHLASHSFIHWATWLGVVAGCVSISFILAEGKLSVQFPIFQEALLTNQAIPFFGDLTSLIGALLGAFMCMTSNGWMWLHDNWRFRREDKSLYYKALVALNVFLIISGLFIMVTGTWAAAVAIKRSYATGAISSPFSCADNSGSV